MALIRNDTMRKKIQHNIDALNKKNAQIQEKADAEISKNNAYKTLWEESLAKLNELKPPLPLVAATDDGRQSLLDAAAKAEEEAAGNDSANAGAGDGATDDAKKPDAEEQNASGEEGEGEASEEEEEQRPARKSGRKR